MSLVSFHLQIQAISRLTFLQKAHVQEIVSKKQNNIMITIYYQSPVSGLSSYWLGCLSQPYVTVGPYLLLVYCVTILTGHMTGLACHMTGLACLSQTGSYVKNKKS